MLVELLCIMKNVAFNFFTGAASQLEITASYTTSFRCTNGSYALISGDNLSLKYDYGCNISQVRIILLIIIFHIFNYLGLKVVIKID